LNDYISGRFCDFLNARRVINGSDKANIIKGYAEKFRKCLEA
jgi:putative chitinase